MTMRERAEDFAKRWQVYGDSAVATLEFFGNEVRNAALEDAARVADDYGRDPTLSKSYACETADELAAQIRALGEEKG